MTSADPMLPDAREQKLPQWAQQKMERLRRRVTDAEARAEEARLAGPEDTDTFLDPYDDIPIRLPKGAHIRFQVAPGDRFSFLDARVTRRGGGVEITSNWAGLRMIAQASNIVLIQPGER